MARPSQLVHLHPSIKSQTTLEVESYEVGRLPRTVFRLWMLAAREHPCRQGWYASCFRCDYSSCDTTKCTRSSFTS